MPLSRAYQRGMEIFRRPTHPRTKLHLLNINVGPRPEMLSPCCAVTYQVERDLFGSIAVAGMESYLFQVGLTVAVVFSTCFTIFILTLPEPFEPFLPDGIFEDAFTDEDKRNADRSGYAYFQRRKQRKEDQDFLRTECSVQLVVLGDIGRSPRMQYHALSIAALGGKVKLIGYVDSEVHPDVQASRFIEVIPIRRFPKQLRTDNKLLFLILAPLKVLWQAASLYYALGYRSDGTKWIIVQNPPGIPTLMVARFYCLIRGTRLIVDWHNFSYSILALRLGQSHPAVKIAAWFEGVFARGAKAHIAVTDAMTKALKQRWSLEAGVLHDRPPKHFQPLSREQRSAFLHRLPQTAQYATDIEKRKWRLIVSSTSWTADEDFSILLDALVDYSSSVQDDSSLPKILAIITGKGPLKEHCLSRIRELNQANKLHNVVIATAWLNTADYASLLGSADLGVSLHTSSSGVDLPMKVVDMFGTGLPVAGWSKFEAWPELVQEGKNGRGFESAEGLTQILEDMFHGDGKKLEGLRQGALKECGRRWDDEWVPVAGPLLELKS